MNNHPCTTSRRPQIGRSPRFSGSIFLYLLFLNNFPYEFTPRHQLLYACGLIFIVRHIQQECIEILIKCFRLFALAVFNQAHDVLRLHLHRQLYHETESFSSLLRKTLPSVPLRCLKSHIFHQEDSSSVFLCG